jgi:hypothetical protein
MSRKSRTGTTAGSRTGAALLAVALTAALASCSGNAGSSPWIAKRHRVRLGAPSDHNASDSAFAKTMLESYGYVLLLNKLAPEHGASPDVRAFLAGLADKQRTDNQKLQGWTQKWGDPSISVDLKGSPRILNGSPWDEDCLSLLNEHVLQNGLAAAKREQRSGKYSPAKKMAADVVARYSAASTAEAKIAKRHHVLLGSLPSQ